ncbi:MAG: 2-C-methyl-D-erythritol 4-phosphate cytidylyltransferase [Spirochaetales bacterium]|nr:2-C-methyl-D-erythritol 4-phosphate cytidylyltransferase [Spirochaetales bacterium]
MKVFAIIVAGGSGSRLGGERPKQFLFVQDRMIIEYSLQTFLTWPRTAGLILVSHADFLPLCESLLGSARSKGISAVVTAGGQTRHASTLCGLARLPSAVRGDDVILVHDAARPFVSARELDLLLQVFEGEDVMLASLAAPVVDTLFAATGLPGRTLESLDRSRIFAIKTPQALRYRALEQLDCTQDRDYTDLLSWGQAAGIAGELVAADAVNRKITGPEDLEWMHARLQSLRE